MTTWHAPQALLQAYATHVVSPAAALSLEAHLDSCAECRASLVRVLPSHTARELESVAAQLRPRLDAEAHPVRVRRTRSRSVRSAPAAWLLACLTVLALATALDAGSHERPALVLLLSPALPLLGVGVAWGSRLDPFAEVTASTPAAGLHLLLRRTFTVLLAVAPAAAVAALVSGASAAWLWMLPCLGLTALALALGGVIGPRRATTSLGAAWAALVVLPGITGSGAPTLVTAQAGPWWLLACAAAVLVVVRRRSAYAVLPN